MAIYDQANPRGFTSLAPGCGPVRRPRHRQIALPGRSIGFALYSHGSLGRRAEPAPKRQRALQTLARRDAPARSRIDGGCRKGHGYRGFSRRGSCLPALSGSKVTLLGESLRVSAPAESRSRFAGRTRRNRGSRYMSCGPPNFPQYEPLPLEDASGGIRDCPRSVARRCTP